jgi:hypothetical protein
MRRGSKKKKQRTETGAVVAEPVIFSVNTVLFTLCFDHLSPLSFAMLMRASPDAHRCRARSFPWLTMQAFTMRRVRTELERFYQNKQVAEIICAHLGDGTTTFLTGGFLTAVLNGDNVLQCSDVDIFINGPSPELKEAIAPFYTEHAEVTPSYNVLRNLLSVIDTRHVLPCGKKIQFLHGKNGWPIGTYVQSFDLPFCQNYLGCGGGVLRCTRDSVNAMLTRSHRVDLTHTFKIPVVYAAISSVNRDFCLGRACESIYKRLKKYATKGYDIYCAEEESGSDQWSVFWRNCFDPVTKKLIVF